MTLAALMLLTAGGQMHPGAPCPPELITEQRVSGIYVDDFEDQRFFPGARRIADVDFRQRPKIHFEPDIVKEGARVGMTSRTPGDAYRLTMRVRLHSRPEAGSPPRMPCGYGHTAGSDMRMDLLEIEDIELLGPVR